MKSTFTRLVGALVAATLALTGCSSSSSDGGNDDSAGGTFEGDIVVLGLVAEPASLDFTTTDGAAIPQLLLDNVYETLVTVGPDGEIAPGLATDWTVSDDGLSYTFTLTDKAVFSDGAPFTADDAKFSIDRVKTDWTIDLKAKMDVVESVTVNSSTELVVTLSKPSNTWLYNMTTRIGAMFSKDGVADLANTPIGTGPYTFGEWQRGDRITLNRNDSYWGEKPHFKTVEFKYFDNATSMNSAMLGGEIDVVTTVQAPEALDQFTDGPKADQFQVIEGTTNGEVVLSFNQSSGPLADVRVRQAIRSAIDHKTLLENCWAGKGELIGSMVPPTDPWYEDRTVDFLYDTQKAESLLKEAGAEDITLRLRLPSLPYAQSCGPEVQSQLSKVGITVDIDTLEFPAAWIQTVMTDKDFDMSIVSHVEPRDLPTLFADPSYYTSYDNPMVQDLVASADAGTPEEQVEDMKQAATIISQDAAADFLFLLPNLIVAKPGIDGLPENIIGESFPVADLTA
ncbi:ABC transporter substrate-binding protein [Cumulibacter soli]|uniref:ABC transporter substrate-binding protein n=1 Tax=Cumulibacter soli TaxID=2546344 RepID=UPI001067F0B5|nr:ABC transporter substrate-binding protein [Cumulibacter soli]